MTMGDAPAALHMGVCAVRRLLVCVSQPVIVLQIGHEVVGLRYEGTNGRKGKQDPCHVVIWVGQQNS